MQNEPSLFKIDFSDSILMNLSLLFPCDFKKSMCMCVYVGMNEVLHTPENGSLQVAGSKILHILQEVRFSEHAGQTIQCP